MPLHNSEIVNNFRLMADLLSIKGDNPFRIRAYRNAAQTVANLSDDLYDMVKNNEDLTKFEGIGKKLSEKIKEMVKDGKMSALERLKDEISPELADMLEIAGLGPERVKTIYNELNIKSIAELKKAAKEHKIHKLSGLGEKTEKKIIEDIEKREKEGNQKRILFSRGEEIVKPLEKYLSKLKEINKVEIAGSYRRRKETIGDIDILVCGNDSLKIMEYFNDYEDISEILSSGETKSSVILKNRIQVDLRVVNQKSYGSALQYFTGSKEHSVKLRKISQEKGLKINEYGIFDKENRIGGKEEKDIYKILNIPYIEPELRENRGELDVKNKSDLPDLIKISDIKGDLQMHTNATDGRNSMEEMIEAAIKKGYEYIAITDHSKRVTVAQGLDETSVKKQIDKINKMNDKYKNIKILKSMEVDILKDGSLDLSEEILSQLDIRVCAIHYNTNLSREEQTERMIKAIENPFCDIIAHPTGRIIGKRAPYEIDLDKVIDSAKKNKCILEINAQPDRLDLSDKYIKKSVENNVKLAISTDAHSTEGLNNIKYGVYQARRGWCEAKDIVNTLNLNNLMSFINKDLS